MTTVNRFRGHIYAIVWVVLIASLCASVATAQQVIDGVTAVRCVVPIPRSQPLEWSIGRVCARLRAGGRSASAAEQSD